MRKAISLFLTDAHGSAMIEYCLVTSAIAVALISAISAIGGALSETYQAIVSGISAVNGGIFQ